MHRSHRRRSDIMRRTNPGTVTAAALNRSARMIDGGLVQFDHYLEQTKRPQERIAIWNWAKLVAACSEFPATERGTAALTRPGIAEDVAIAPGISAAVQSIAAGERTSPHAHSFWHIYIVQGGRGMFEGGSPSEARPITCGDIVYVPPWCDHVLSNEGEDEPLILLALQNLPAMADAGCLARRDSSGQTRLVYASEDQSAV